MFAMANGKEDGEIDVSTLRVGMKREFAMMMRAQAECGIKISQGRVTRSQLGALSNSVLPKRSGSGAKLVDKKGSNGNKRMKESKIEVLELVKLDDLNEAKKNGFTKAGSICDKEGLVSKDEHEQETGRGVVVGLFVEDRKGEIVEGAAEGEGKEVVGFEIACNDVVKNVEEMESDVGTFVAAEEPVDNIAGRVNDRSKVIKDNGDFVTPSRRVTRSMKSTVESPELSVTEEENGIKGVKTLRRVTRSTLNTKMTSDMEAEKSEAPGSDSVNPVSSSPKLEMKMSKKVALKNTPSTLEDLLGTGLLEGLHVRYAKAGMPGEGGFPGKIKGSGILCFCDVCKGSQIVTLSQFELHAGGWNNNPADFTYLDNGKTLYDVLTACRDASSDWVERAIQISTGRANTKESIGCLRCKGDLPKLGVSGRMLCDSCITLEVAQVCPPDSNNESAHCSSPNISKECSSDPMEPNDISALSFLSVSPAKSLVKAPSSIHSRSKSQGRLTRKDVRLHKLVFESDILPDGTQLAYYARGQKMREGYKSGHGIHCNCCNEVVSASTFEAHAGFASRRKPYMYIYTSNGVSLHELSIEIKKTLMLSTDENDDVCSICKGMGELLCCDNCPRSFHKECVDLPSIPHDQDRWYCRYCVNMFQKESFVASNINAFAAGRIAGSDPFEEIKKRCIRIVETLDAEDGGCVLCRGRDFSKLGFGPRTVIICDQCEREFHIGCLKEHEMGDLQVLPDEWFCCKECSSMHSALQQLVKDGDKMLPDSMLSIIRKKHETIISEGDHDFKLSWRLLRGKMASEDDRKWLSGAVSVLHDRFDPIGHSNTRRDDLIPLMIYGRSNKQQDFGGMYCAILVLNSTIVSTGIFRIFGKEVAEIPLVATSNDFQGKGYFQTLFGCIENLLATMEVKNLVLPAASEAEEIWRNKFSFDTITGEQLNTYRKDYPMMVFQGTSMLYKSIQKPEVPPTGAKDV